MEPANIDFLDEKNKLVVQPKKKKILKIGKILIYGLVIFFVIAVVYTIGIFSSGENLARTLGNVSLWGQIQHLIGSDEKALQGEAGDRINVLLLGIGGADHDGPYLTDTIIVASIKPSTKQVALISLPRDLLVPIPGYGWRKINNANAFGEVDQGNGGQLATQVVSQVLNIPIHYFLRLDFAGFVDIIDTLGGINIDVENTLDDPYYPVKGKETATTTERYERLYIEAGRHHFSGELALKYVRSRQALGIEGSDFARSKRQQKILLAVKDKALSFSTLTNPYKISRLMDALSQHLATNLQVWEILRLFNLSQEVKEGNIIDRVFDDSPDSILYSTITADGAFVIEPKAGDFFQLQTIVQNIFDPQALAQAQPTRLEIQNGTKVEGLAYRHAQYLQSLGYQVIRTKNAPTQDYQTTVIYNLGDQPQTAQNLAKLLAAEPASVLPNWITSTSSPAVSPNADILIILGADRQNL